MISIIIPVYNVERFLTRCIDSILKQSYKLYEVILIDDGSTDKSGEICDSYIGDKRFKVIHQSNQGVSAARNKGLSLLTGDYVLFVDADDWLDPEMLMKLFTGIGDADLAMCFYNMANEKPDGEFEFIDYWKHDRKDIYKVKNVYYEILNKSATLWNKLIKRTVIGNQLFRTDMTYGEDSVFLAECLKKTSSAVIVPECLYYYYRGRQGNVVSSAIDKRSLELLENTKVLYNLCKSDHCPSVGIRRIIASIGEVHSKIQLTRDDILDKKKYIKACNSLMKYPSCYDFLCFFQDEQIPFSDKRTAILYRFGLLYMFFKVLKRKVKG